MEEREIKELTISALVLALAFSVMFSRGLGVLTLSFLPLSLIAVSAGFVSHELAHRYVARRFGCFAEYRMWPLGLMLALLFSFFGFVFAAPGAVVIRQRVDLWGYAVRLERKEYGMISLAGPSANIALAVAFLLLHLRFPWMVFLLGARINTWLALFNLLPFPPFDGSKVFFWNKVVWLCALLAAISMLILFH